MAADGCRRVGVVSWLFTREVRRELSLTLAERLAFQGCKRRLASVFGPNEIVDSLPTPEWVSYLSRFTALALMVMLVQMLEMPAA